LSFFFFFLKRGDVPSPWSTTCFPLALRGVEHRGHRLLSVIMVAHNVEELMGHTRHATPDPVDQGGAHRFVLKLRDVVVIGRTGELGAALGEASYVLAKALPGLLLAVAQLPLLAGAHVRALEVANEDPTLISPVLDLVARQVLEPRACGVTEVKW
jgi:hypothetical protein